MGDLGSGLEPGHILCDLPELTKAMTFQVTLNVVKMMIGNVAAAGGHVRAAVGEVIELGRGGIACECGENTKCVWDEYSSFRIFVSKERK